MSRMQARTSSILLGVALVAATLAPAQPEPGWS